MEAATKKNLAGMVLIWVSLIVLVLLFRARLQQKQPLTPQQHAVRLVMKIDTALEQFNAEYGHYPQGDAKAVIAALLGPNAQNPHGTKMLELGTADLDSADEPVDPWQTPLLFLREEEGGRPAVSSAGPDKILGTADDIAAKR